MSVNGLTGTNQWQNSYLLVPRPISLQQVSTWTRILASRFKIVLVAPLCIILFSKISNKGNEHYFIILMLKTSCNSNSLINNLLEKQNNEIIFIDYKITNSTIKVVVNFKRIRVTYLLIPNPFFYKRSLSIVNWLKRNRNYSLLPKREWNWCAIHFESCVKRRRLFGLNNL